MSRSTFWEYADSGCLVTTLFGTIKSVHDTFCLTPYYVARFHAVLPGPRRFQERKSEVEVGAYREALFALTPPIIYQVRAIAPTLFSTLH